uniref:Uncharacterized protein n=1 Tax=Labrus bergylta TaxID=56723 RepID=A0A3Q3FK30_9LABR
MVPEGHIHGHQKCWRGDEEKLKTPEADVGDWEELVVADVFTARLRDRLRLLVPPHALSSNNQHHDAEDEEHGEPDFPQAGGSGPRHPAETGGHRKRRRQHNIFGV